jgi:hypothetical protein
MLMIAIVGCGGDGRVKVSPVRGQVTYGGHPVPNATVIFHPIGEAAEKLKKLRPYAYADEAGKFDLKTYVTGDGAPPGEYEVGVIANSTVDRDSAGGGGGPPTKAASVPRAVSQKYGNPKTSGIKVKIEPGENNLQPFVLN